MCVRGVSVRAREKGGRGQESERKNRGTIRGGMGRKGTMRHMVERAEQAAPGRVLPNRVCIQRKGGAASMPCAWASLLLRAM